MNNANEYSLNSITIFFLNMREKEPSGIFTSPMKVK
jgi:hypothetical protein